MHADKELLQLEREAWKALSTSAEAATTFYSEVLAQHVLMLLPGGTVIDSRQQVIESMQQADWTGFELTDERVLDLTDGSAVVAYKATARREAGEYTALFNSTYVQEDGIWKLAVHQQTPI